MPEKRRMTYAEALRLAMEQLVAEAMACRLGAEEGREDEADPAEPLRRFLSRYIGNRYGIAAGRAFDSQGGASDALDIVLFDAYQCPDRQTCEESGAFFAESVCAVIAVHWTLTTDDLAESLERIASVKALDRSAFIRRGGPPDPLAVPYGADPAGPLPPVWGMVFAYQGDGLSDALMPALAGLDQELPEEERTDCLCVLDQGLVCRGEREGMDQWSVESSYPGTSLHCYERPDEGWLVLRPLLTRELASRELGTPDTMRYLPVILPNLPPPTILDGDEQVEDDEHRQKEEGSEG